MAGLGVTPDTARQGAMAPGGAPAPAGPAAEPQGEPASPEEQAIYNRVVGMAMLAVYDDKMVKKLAEMLTSAPDPVPAIGEIAANIAMRIYTFAKEEGTDIPGDVMLHAGKEIVEVIGELSEAAGAAVDEQQLEMAYFHALDKFRVMAQQQGAYGEDAAQEDMEALRAMQGNGMLDEMMQRVAAMQGGAPAPQKPGAMPADEEAL
jgi:hypothetical protein